MAYFQTINLVTGDTLPQLTLNLKDSNLAAAGKILDEENSETWAPINLTNATVVMRMRPIGSLVVSATLSFTVLNGAAGTALLIFPAGTLSTAGLFEGEIEVNYFNGAKHTVPDLLKLKVRDGFD